MRNSEKLNATPTDLEVTSGELKKAYGREREVHISRKDLGRCCLC